MLYLISTPIGNLKDISFRAIEIMNGCDYLLCEDTRHSLKLLRHFEIHKPLVSHHQFNEASRENKILEDLRKGLTIGLLSDAGTPGISDPGTRIVKRCHEENLPVTAIPGACAAVTALSLSGLETERFQFLGFPPRKEGELHSFVVEALQYPGTSVCYESPKRILKLIEKIASLDPERSIVIARELTKKFEEVRKAPAKEFLDMEEPKGEIVLLIEGCKEKNDWEALSPEEHVAWLEKNYALSRKEAIKMAAEQRGVPKREIYRKFLDN